MAVRAAVSPSQQWKSVGDAAPHIAKRSFAKPSSAPVARAAVEEDLTSAAKAELLISDGYGTAEAVPLSKTGSSEQARISGHGEILGPRVIRTVATTRQVADDGAVIVTRSVTFTAWNAAARNPDASRSVSDSPQPQGERSQLQQQQLHRYAAIPVQGGWLLFQL